MTDDIWKWDEKKTRSELVDKLLEKSGWIKDKNSIEEYTISPGRIVDEDGQRINFKKADYVLFYPNAYSGQPIAVIEAKKASKDVLSGLEQAKRYMNLLNVSFAYATNGIEIVEYDRTTKKAKRIENFPTPEELWERKVAYEGIIDPDPLKVPYKIAERKKPRYYQYIAVERAIKAILNGQKRVLLTMATGCGKTYVAFQIFWKLYHAGKVRRVLYLVDRVFLREQAYNAFEPFGNARIELTSENITMSKDIYFATYQTLYSKKGNKRIYEFFDRDFFDIVIIDECHRSGWKRWHDILRYFSDAIHIGLTATPKRTDNVDTYAYFGRPVYEYPMAKGIEDGFLAPPEEIITLSLSTDKKGKLVIKELRSKGIRIEVPKGAKLKEEYTAEEFEKTIILPDRTRKIVEWIINFLESTDPLAKTVIFCPTQRHAREVATLLNNYFNPKFNIDNYAYPIIAEDTEAHQILRKKFARSEEIFPVVATTVDVLSTGVDIPPIRNIIFLKRINSKVEFHQIIGRATRIDDFSRKYVFRIVDFTKTTELFDEWDIPSVELFEDSAKDWFLKIQIVDAETFEPIQNADVIVFVNPSNPIHISTGENGFVTLSNVPRNAVRIDIKAQGYKSKETVVSTFPDENPRNLVRIMLKKEGKKELKPIKVEGLDVYVDEESRLRIDINGNKLLDAEYIKYTKDNIKKKVTKLDDLRDIWKDEEKRRRFKEDLKELGIDLRLLAKIRNLSDADEFDFLAHILFNAPIVSRDERARLCLEVKRDFISKFGEKVRELIFDLIDRYRMFGIDEMQSPEVLNLPQFKEAYGGFVNVIKMLGDGDPKKGIEKFKLILREIEKGIYADLYGEV